MVSALSVSRHALKLLMILALVYGAGILALLIATLVAEAPVMAALGVKLLPGTGGLVAAMRAIMVIGIIAVPVAWLILARLLAIVESVRAGDPFTNENARRLQTIGWALLGLKLLSVVVAAIAASAATETNPLDIGWPTDVTGWLAVLLLFVLAKVFEEGARMREELAGTV